MKIMGLKNVKLQMMNSCLTLHTCVLNSPCKKTPQEKNHQIHKTVFEISANSKAYAEAYLHFLLSATVKKNVEAIK